MTGVKICGIKTEAALDAAVDAGADYIGLVLFPKSPRNVDIAIAAGLAKRARKRSQGRTSVVALLVDPIDALVEEVVCEVRPDVIQLHGHESLWRVREIAAGTDVAIWKAVPVATDADVSAAQDYWQDGGAVLLLYDAKAPSGPAALPGGNGLAFDWRILGERGRGGVLAGGLTPENVAEAIRLVAPMIVDVSSGVETSPGEKSPELIRRFIQAAKAANG